MGIPGNMLCSRCKERMAVIFLTTYDNGKRATEGLCISCAREAQGESVGQILGDMGLDEEQLSSMEDFFGEFNEMLEGIDEEDDLDEEGRTATFPFQKLFNFGADRSEESSSKSSDQPQRQKREKNRDGAPKRKFLETYCQNLTQKAKDGKFDNIIGRTAEIARVVQILNRRQKNNPCLIGEPGVGKTAIAEGLAQRIAAGTVPYKLQTKEVFLLDLTALVAGTQFRGQFESRMKGLVEEIRELGNIILFIDEIHTLVGAGDAEGSLTAANILKPALSRGEIQVIGATTFTEYRKHIEKDAALERRFQPVTVEESSVEDAIEIIKGIAKYYESFHGVLITPESARWVVELSERYLTDRYLPDKAIDLLDETCSDINLKHPHISEREKVRADIDQITAKRAELTKGGGEGEKQTADYFQQMATLRTQELQLENRIKELASVPAPELTLDAVAETIERWTGIPASKIEEMEFARLRTLEDRLLSKIIGQDDAVKAVAKAVKRNRVGLSAVRRPASFIFAGPTGVGKTELVKQLAADLFDSPDALIRLDMSEFMEKHTVSRIVGSPPGYVGYDEAGQLTEKVRRKPYCIILFDEIEKAHPDIMNILLQILDDGHITDAQGRKVNFANTVIVMTTNAGSEKSSGLVGFNHNVSQGSKEKAMKSLSDFLRPEFINRIDEIVAFNNLTKENFRGIAKLMIDELETALTKRKMYFSYTDDFMQTLIDESFTSKYGARNLRRAVQKHIEDPIAEMLISAEGKSPTHFKGVTEDGKVRVVNLN